MRSKLSFLITVSLKRKIKSKWFVVANVLLCLVICGLCNMDAIITVFGGDFTSKTNVYVIDKTSMAYELLDRELKETGNMLGKESNYQLQQYHNGLSKAKEELKKDKKGIILILDNSKTALDVQMITNEYMSLVDIQLINAALNNTKIYMTLDDLNISQEDYATLNEPVFIDRVYLKKNATNKDENAEAIISTVFPMIVIPVFMLIIFLIQMIGAEVNDEKTTKSMEIIISNVSPTVHFFSKVIAGNLFVLMQGVLLVLFAFIGFTIRNIFTSKLSLTSNITEQLSELLNSVVNTNIGDKLIYIIPLAIILLIITFISYALLAGIFASMTTNTEDFQQLQTPIIVILLIGYYLSIMASVFQGATFIYFLGFVPLISAILAPSLLVLGQFGVIEFIISILFDIVLNYILIKYGLKIYKVGILNYSSKDLWKKMFKAIKE